MECIFKATQRAFNSPLIKDFLASHPDVVVSHNDDGTVNIELDNNKNSANADCNNH